MPDPPADGERRRRRRLGVAALAFAVLAVLLAASGLVLLPRTTAEPVPGEPAVDAGADGSEGADVDLEVEGPGPLPGFALGDELGEDPELLDAIIVDGEWPRGGGPAHVPEPADPTPIPPTDQPQPEPEPQPDGGGEVGDTGDSGDTGEPGDPTPPDGEPPADPCAGLPAGAHLVTTPDPRHLAPGVMASTVTIRNCGTDPVSWSAASKPSVALAEASGSLGAGATHALAFTIDDSMFPDDAIAFKIRVSEPGFNQYVDVTATKMGLAQPEPDHPAAGDTVTTDGATGCAAQCITTAWLTPNASTPNLDLAVETTTAATMSVFVSTTAPVEGPDGQPAFADVGLIAATNDLNTAWHSLLQPLEAATDYHIIVRATDADGGVSNRIGTFHTITPAVGDLDVASPDGDSGCATQCITKAWLTPDPTSFAMALEVTSHTLARFEAFVSTDAPVVDPDGNPSFPGLAPATTNFAYEQSWTTTLEALEPATRYTVIVKATDGMLRSSYRVGSFETRPGADQMMITFHQVRVDGDGDEHSRGELTFLFAVDGEYLASTKEDRIGSGSTVRLSDGDRSSGISTFVPYAEGPSSWLPVLEAAAFERDGDGVVEFCPGGATVPDAPGRSDDCDWTWNIAGSGLLQDVDSLERCADLGVDDPAFADDRCVRLESASGGGDRPSFSVIASMRPVRV